jgi:hypothetical protein
MTLTPLVMEQGDSYFAADGRAFTWTYTGSISLAGGSVALKIDQLSATGVITGSVPLQTVTFEPTAGQTSALAPGVHRWQVEATLASGHIVTLERGTIDVGANT